MLNKILSTFCLIPIICMTSFAQEEQKEVLLIGTMHDVPNYLKKSYRPLLKKAKKYSPEAIYVEVSMPNDSLSWEYLKNGYSKFSSNFYSVSDSLKTSYPFDEKRLNELLSKRTEELSQEELTVMVRSFAYLRDAANYKHYRYVKKYGIKGSKKPLRTEDYDLVSKLALYLNHKKILATDDQQTNDKFHEYWRKCLEVGDTKQETKLTRKMNRKFIFPSLFGHYGTYTNNQKVLKYLHDSSSLRLSHSNNEDCKKATQYWDERNQRIVKNLGTQILEKSHKKSVLVIGASHIIGVKDELEKQFPDIKVILFDDFRRNK